jgi:hypothetical protein
MAIHVKVRCVAVEPLADKVRKPSHREHIPRPIECQAIIEVEPLARPHFGGDRLKARIVCSKTGLWASLSAGSLHTLMIQNLLDVKRCVVFVPLIAPTTDPIPPSPSDANKEAIQIMDSLFKP